MKTPTPTRFITKSESGDRSPSRLMSLLAMATGALAMPQASDADIIFTDLSGNLVSVAGTNSATFLIDSLPGTARLGFCGHTILNPTLMLTSHTIRASQRAGYIRLKTNGADFVDLVGPGLKWSQIGDPNIPPSLNGGVATARLDRHNPDSFDHLYMAFKFKDSTLPPADNVRYGWVDLGLLNANGAIPILTIFGYAYVDTGARIQTGIIPEPAPIALLAIGALTLGAKGVRSWLRKRAAA